MSGFEVVGLILALYPVVIDAVQYCKKVRSGEIIRDIFEDVRTERIIFCNYIQQLCISKVASSSVQGITDPESNSFRLWKEETFLADMLASRDREAVVSILQTLKGIYDELLHVHQDLAQINPSGVSLKPMGRGERLLILRIAGRL